MALNPNGRTATVKAQIINDLQMSGVVLIIHPYEDGQGFGLHIYGAHGHIRDFDFDSEGVNVGAGTDFFGTLDDVDGVEKGGWAAEDFSRCPACGSVAISYHDSEPTINEDGTRQFQNNVTCGACGHVIDDSVETMPPVPKTPEEFAEVMGGIVKMSGFGTGEMHEFPVNEDGTLGEPTIYFEGTKIEPDEEVAP